MTDNPVLEMDGRCASGASLNRLGTYRKGVTSAADEGLARQKWRDCVMSVRTFGRKTGTE